MNVYLNQEDDKIIKYSGGSAPYPGEQFESGGKTWSVSKVEPCTIRGSSSGKLVDRLATCEEVKSYIVPTNTPYDTASEFLRGLKFSPDGKAQSFEKDGRLWHRTRTETSWTDWVEYV